MKIIPKVYWYPALLILTLVAFFSLYFTLYLPYLGEEGQYTLSALEMVYHHYYWQPFSFGGFYWRPPLYNWFIIAAMYLTGPAHILVAARLVTASASVLTGVMLWFLSQRLFQQKLFAVLTVAAFFSGDFLFRRGWIVSSDPIFSLATFIAVSCLWISYKEQRPVFWIPVPLALFAAVLIKAFTAYIFYGTALLVIWLASDSKIYLFKPASILAHVAAILLPVLWFVYVPNANWHGMLGDITHRTAMSSFPLAHYFKKIISAPYEVLLRLAPVDLLAFYSLYHRKRNPDAAAALPSLDPKLIKILLWIIGLSALPYWLAPSNLPIHYFLPLMPLAAIVFSYCIWRGGEKMVSLAVLVLAIELGLKCVSSFVGLPWFEHMNWPQQQIAQDIIQRSQHYENLYAEGMDSRVGLSVTATIDALRWPQAPLISPPQFSNGCVITPNRNPAWGELQQIYAIKRQDPLYLYCAKPS